MPASAKHPEESRRIKALYDLEILDTAAESLYDGLVDLAAQIAEVPIALLSLVDNDRQWFKSKVGIDACETPRSQSFCSHAILDRDHPLIVEDATLDPRFADNPLVLTDPLIRFYAGMPLRAPGEDSLPVGTLCLIDRQPRQITEKQIAALRVLSEQVEQIFALRAAEQAKLAAGVALHKNSQLIELSHDAIYSWTRRDGVKSWNRGAEQLFGYSKEVAIGTDTKELLGEIRPTSWQEIDEGIASRGEWTGEVHYETKDGRNITVSTRHQKVALGDEEIVLATSRDITDIKRVEVTLKRLGEIVDRSRNEIFIFRRDTLHFEYVNQGATKNLGYTLEELKAMTPLDIKPEFELPMFVKLVEPLRNGQQDYLSFETVHQRKDTSLYNVEVHLQRTDYNGHECFVAIIVDTTTLKKSIGELKQANSDLEHFAYVASHDLRSPLRGISNLVTFLREDEADNLSELSREYLDKLEQRAHRMESLLDDLLVYSRVGRQNGNLQSIDVVEFVEDAVELLSPPEGFRVVVQSNVSSLETYATPLRQVVMNLIGNAFKHHDKDCGMVSVIAEEDEDMVRFTVSDDGPGIEEQYHEKIFEMFQSLRTKDEVEGSGMGLAIIRRLVREYGGDIRLESKPGQGASFIFSWPKQIKEVAAV